MLKSPSVNKLPEVNPGAKSRFIYPKGNSLPCSDTFPYESLLHCMHLVKTNTTAQEKALCMLTAAFSFHDECRWLMMVPF